jgi:hypothetical protein
MKQYLRNFIFNLFKYLTDFRHIFFIVRIKYGIKSNLTQRFWDNL